MAAPGGDTPRFGGRVMTAVATLGGLSLTPVALTGPGAVSVDFEIRWDTDEDPDSTPGTG